MRLISKVHLA